MCIMCGFKMLLEGLEHKGHVAAETAKHAVVQAIFNKCKGSSSSVRHRSSKRWTKEQCIVAVSDWRKDGAPSGF